MLETKNNKPLLSVAMITYNHGLYIREAIEGVLMQQVDFDFELVISNDCSSDDTDFVIRDIVDNHSKRGIIKYFNHDSNLGMSENSKFIFNQINSKYVAICEGDDYWTDPYKLQKQVDFLEKNPDFSLCFHRVNLLEGDKFCGKCPNEPMKEVTDQLYLSSKPNYIPTLSVVFRNPEVYSEYIFSLPNPDYGLHLYNAERGKIKYFSETMGVYRKGVGVWSKQDGLKKTIKTIDSYDKLISVYQKKSKKIFDNLKKVRDSYFYYYLTQKLGYNQYSNFIRQINKEDYSRVVGLSTKVKFIIKYLLKK